MYLIDTDILSAARKLPEQHPVVTWLNKNEMDVFLSTTSVAEIERGIEKQRRVNPSFANDLETWLKDILATFRDRTLPLTVNIAQRWGRMQFQLGRSDADLAIAATALEHGLQVVTRNVRHFDTTGVSVLNPFEPVP
jgi:hypothetical protein